MMTTTENRKLLDQNRQEGLKFIENLRRLCNEILEPIIILIGPTFITSAFRCPALNNSVGGAKNSQHTAAEAADTHYNIPLREAFNKIAFSSNISFGQLILEFEQWVHCSCTDSVLYPGKVSQKFIASRQDGKTIYTAVVSPI
jgi:Peptidase M15.